jgi:hypothetical protein
LICSCTFNIISFVSELKKNFGLWFLIFNQIKRLNETKTWYMLAAYNTPVHGAVWVGAVLHAVVMVYGWFYMLLHVCCMGVIGVEW